MAHGDVAVADRAVEQPSAKIDQQWRLAGRHQAGMEGAMGFAPAGVRQLFDQLRAFHEVESPQHRGAPFFAAIFNRQANGLRFDHDAHAGDVEQVLDGNRRDAETALRVRDDQILRDQPRQRLAQGGERYPIDQLQPLEAQARAGTEYTGQDVLAQAVPHVVGTAPAHEQQRRPDRRGARHAGIHRRLRLAWLDALAFFCDPHAWRISIFYRLNTLTQISLVTAVDQHPL